MVRIRYVEPADATAPTKKRLSADSRGMPYVQALLAVSRIIDAINARLGKWVSWLVVAVVIVSATKSDPNAVMAAFGSVIAPAGVPTGSVTVSVGLGTSTQAPITVTAPDGTPKVYHLTVSRAFR